MIMKYPSVADIVFFMIALTLCYLAIVGKPIDPQFLILAGTVVGSFYTHKAQIKTDIDPYKSSTYNQTSTETHSLPTK